MSLKDKQSLYDRSQNGVLGSNVGTDATSPLYFSDKGSNMTSPFDATPDLSPEKPGGQMVDLLTKRVKSNNHGYPLGAGSVTYDPGNLDLNYLPGTSAVGQPSDFFDKGVLSNRKGQYKNGGPIDGRY